MLTILSNKRVVAIIGLIGFFLFLTQPQGVQAAGLVKAPNNLGLVGYWSFEDGKLAKATDFSGKGNTGTLTNMEEADWVQGKAGKGLSFDGVNEYVSLSNSAIIGDDTTFTISAWVKFSSIGDFSTIYGEFPSTGSQAKNYFGTYQSKIFFDQYSPDGGFLQGATTLTANRWYHAVYSQNGTSRTIYLDGVSDASDNSAETYSGAAATTAYIGLRGAGHNTYFNGSIDEVRIYSRALSVTEVASLYSQGSQSLIKNASRGLVAHWTFEEGTGTTTADKTGNGNTGTLTNGPTWSAGKFGKGISFDGTNDYIDIIGATEAPPTLFSISFWVKPSGFLDTKGIITKASSNDNGPAVSFDNSGYLHFPQYSSAMVSNAPVPTTSWTHVVVEHDGSSHNQMYVNGVLQNATSADSITNGGVEWVLGRYYSNYDGFYFRGLLDDVRIYNRALSAQEVLNLYNSSGEALGILNRVHRDVLTSGLAGYWSFDGSQMSGNTALDSSGSGLSATLTSGPSKTIGVLGQGIQLDGVDDYVTVGDALALNGAQPRTLSTWLKFSADPLTSAQWIIERGNATNATYWLWWNGDNSYSLGDNTLICGQRISNGSGEQVANTWTPSPNIWYHVACTYTGTQLVEYINGVQLGSAGSATGSVADETSTARSLQFGRRTSTGGNLFVGYLDDVRIYSRALTASEILSLFNLAGGSSLNP